VRLRDEKNMHDLSLSGYDYQLPQESIAQTPAVPRDSSRLLVVDSPDTHHHAIFRDLVDWLEPGDLLVLNDTKVLPARLYGRKSTGAPVEILLLEEKEHNCWLSLVKPGKRFKIGTEIWFEPHEDISPTDSFRLKAITIDRDEATAGRLLQFAVPDDRSFLELLPNFGQLPLPPYITSTESEPSQYQTVYADEVGSVAAPTAGLHFTEELLQKLEAKGIDRIHLTLHVGVGTFRPVETENIVEHHMHQEWIRITPEIVAKIHQTKANGGRIIAVGTTAVRAIEGAVKEAGGGEDLVPYTGKTNIFIYPGYRWRVIDGMVTNFHLPKSSLAMLVSALIGRERLLSLYREAIDRHYRFYSFGDAMLILPEAKMDFLQTQTDS
jgi:S-adenosylmethionine:tRNA ribosyltransferase-isomerase